MDIRNKNTIVRDKSFVVCNPAFSVGANHHLPDMVARRRGELQIGGNQTLTPANKSIKIC